MAEAKRVGSVPQRSGRRKRKMAPASADGLGVRMEGGVGEGEGVRERERDWCKQCLGRGEKTVMRYLQINDELAVFVCDAEQCTSLPTLAPGCELVVQRRAADIVNSRRRKKRSHSLPSVTMNAKANIIPSDPAMDSSSTKNSDMPGGQSQSLLQSRDPPVTEVMPSALPTTSVLQWPNEGQQCWLDVSMLLLLQFGSLRRCHQALGATSILSDLCNAFDEAQRMVGLLNLKDLSQGGQQVATNSSNNQTPTGHLNNNHLDADLLQSSLRESGVGLHDLQDEFFELMNNSTPMDFLDALVQNAEQLEDSGVEAEKCPNKPVHHASSAAAHSSSGNSVQDGSTNASLSTPDLAAAIDFLIKKRKSVLEKLKTSMSCEEGEDDSPVTALPVLLRQGGAIEEHFSSRYRREFYCFACGFTNVTIHRNAVMSLTAASSDFSMQRPTIHHPCPQCKAPGQTSHLKYHSIPACPLVHFSQGLNEADTRPWNERDFRHQGHAYQLRAVVQYKTNPNHFLIWIRDPEREMWLKCDDLSMPICHWQSQEPSIPPSEVHIMGWERQGGDCNACTSLQQHMTEILEAPVKVEAEMVGGRAASLLNGSSEGVPGYDRKGRAAVMARRSASPVLRRGNSFDSFRARSHSLPTSDRIPIESILSIGTPPQSPESQTPKKNDNAMSSSPDTILANDASKRKSPKKKCTPIGRDSHLSDMSVTDSGMKAKYSSMSAARIFHDIPAQIMSKPHLSMESMESASYDSQPKKGISVLRALRHLGMNSATKVGGKREETAKAEVVPKKRQRVQQQVVAPQPKPQQPLATPLPRKIKKLHMPKRKFDSFDAYKQNNLHLFSGYMTRKDLPSVPRGKTSSKQTGSAGGQEDDKYQSSVLLTPSSSVSSPSSCSESSLQNENVERIDNQELIASLDTANNSSNEFSNTMDELYKALDIAAQPAPQDVVSHQACVLDTDTFLNDLLR